MAARSPTVAMPRRSSRASVAGPTPHRACTGSGCRKASTSSTPTTLTPRPGSGPWTEAFGLAASEASLATNFDGATPTEQVSPSSSSTRDRMRRAISGAGPWRRRALSHVEERLVERDRLDQRGEGPEDRHDPGADLAVAGVVAGEEHGLGAQAAGSHRRHGREHTEGPGLVRRRSHHPPVARTAHDHGSAPQLGLVEQLDRHEEGVHVDVQDARRFVHVRVIANVDGSSPATW